MNLLTITNFASLTQILNIIGGKNYTQSTLTKPTNIYVIHSQKYHREKRLQCTREGHKIFITAK